MGKIDSKQKETERPIVNEVKENESLQLPHTFLFQTLFKETKEMNKTETLS